MANAEIEAKPFWTALRLTWYQFCSKTSIHGLKFTNDDSTNRTIRLIWWIITLSCLICSIKMAFDLYENYISNPTRIHFDSDQTSVASLYFPSITICPETKFNVEKSELYISKLKLPASINSRAVLDKLNISTALINEEDVYYQNQDLILMEEILRMNNLSILQFLNNLKWECKDILFRCRYQSEIFPCDEIFKETPTFLGFCCSLNIKRQGMKLKHLFASPGLREGLSVVLYNNDSYVKRHLTASPGFVISIDESSSTPSPLSILKFVPINEEVFMSITTTQTYCSKPVIAMSTVDRQCAFPNEYELKYFSFFVGFNCELNCQILNTMKLCDCIPFYIARNGSTERICSFNDIPCLMEHQDKILGRHEIKPCDCPNKCESFEHEFQVNSAELKIHIPTGERLYHDIKQNFSVLHIFMKSQFYRVMRRDLVYDGITLVSNLGSAFSLFVGMSMVSVVEIIYYFTVILHKNYVQEVKLRRKIFFRKRIFK